MMKKLLPVWSMLVCGLLLTGCATTITNLTPSTQKRSPDGMYPIEVAMDTRNSRIRQETLTPYVLIGAAVYPMQPTLLLKNRWEALVPVPADREFVNYRFKFDYDIRSIPAPRPGSDLSRPYQLQILDR